MAFFLKFIMLAIICCTSISCTDASCTDVSAQQSFLLQQKQCARVKTAFAEKEQIIEENLNKKGFANNNLHILIVAYKAEKQLEIIPINRIRKRAMPKI